MTELAGIRQSVSRASQLLNATGFMDISRGLQTDAYQRNVRAAVRELREAARSLVQENNHRAYRGLSDHEQQMLWQSILLARAPATGAFIISRLGSRYPQMADHVREADRTLSSHANGFPVRELHRMRSSILDAAPTTQTVIEQNAEREGDPMPPGINRPEAELYQRIVLRAIQRSRLEAVSNRNPGEAALDAFSASFLPALPWENPEAFGQDQAEGRFAEIISRGGETAVRESANRIGAMVSLFRAIHDAADAHYRASHPDYRLSHWVHQGCLAETGNDSAAAERLGRRLQDIRQRMNAWLAWLERHPDHPSYVPPYGRIDAAPRASVESTRNGSDNRTGPVQGSVRGAADRGSLGLA
jgi:hypothetical protein